MISQRKIAANQRNGRLSKGPKTQAGKDVSRRNALRDGFTAQKLFMSSENEEEFKHFLAGMVESLQPADGDEDELVNGIGMCRWRLRRIFRAEAALLDGGDDCDAYIVKMASLRCLGDREAKILRTMMQLKKCLDERQAERRRNEQDEPGDFSTEPDVATTSEAAMTAPMPRKEAREKPGLPNQEAGQGGKTNPRLFPSGSPAGTAAETPLDPLSAENGKTNPNPGPVGAGPRPVPDPAVPGRSPAESGEMRATTTQPTAAPPISPPLSPQGVPPSSELARLQCGILVNDARRR